MEVRIAEKRHARAIAENNVRLAEESEGTVVDFQTTLCGVREVLRDAGRGFYLIALEEETVVGQLMVTYEWSDWRNRQIWWLQSIYVTKAWRRRGVMTVLLSSVRRMARDRDVAALKLYVHRDNAAAMRAYERAGLRPAPYVMYETPTDECPAR
jgi:GNAT superfamily N-acetyltransferase